jgi:sigma-B regulation protein RsbU (phosphoserine phosphatase)
VIIHFTLLPGFLGSPRQLLMIAMFALLFGLFGTGIAYAFYFYRQALDKAKAEQELTLARRIQRSFLIEDFPARPRFEVHAVNISSKQVSGDFYDVVPAGDGSYLIAIADVAGKGVPAALLSSMLQASLRTQASGAGSVARVLANINALVYRSTAVNQFATFFLARMDERTLSFSYCNAGHNFPILFRRRGGREELDKGGTIVGILEDVAYEEALVQLEPGDRVVLYTDGINEAANAGGELFGDERLIAAIQGLPLHLSSEEITERLLAEVRGFLNGVEAGDDMTVLVLRVLEPVAIPATVS